MKRIFFLCLVFSALALKAQLISVVYDFDGMATGTSGLPDGDYSNGDLSYEAVPNPLQASDVLGDRVLKLKCNWNAGAGEFGKATMRFIELNASTDRLNFYLYNPLSNSESANLSVVLIEDDNQDNVYQSAQDDKWTHQITVSRSSSWQLFSIPLSSFTDENPGGNGIFDAAYSNAAGMLFNVSFVFTKPTPSAAYDEYFIDMICFSHGPMPTGNSILDLPPGNPSASIRLGALTADASPDQSPASFEGMLPSGKKISFVNWFVYYADQGTSANVFTGAEVQNLINQGYKPIITWESMFKEFPRLHPSQPKLNDIVNGSFDAYIDAFAQQIKTYSGRVIIRILHEFEGDWYSWSLTHNGQNPALYVQAFRHIVDRFRNLGANNVDWMWCVNAEPKPYVAYNWIKNCYPGDNYVDIIATDIYNHPDYGTPAWKSFRYTMAESYYYLTRNFPQKPLYICEVGCRERNSSETGSMQSKADWICMMNKDLKTYFNKTEALVFFSITKEHDWRVNSSASAKQAFIDCIWSDPYYGEAVGIQEWVTGAKLSVFPNPSSKKFTIILDSVRETELKIFDLSGKLVYSVINSPSRVIEVDPPLAEGLYMLELRGAGEVLRTRIVRG